MRGDLSCMKADFVPAPRIANANIKYIRWINEQQSFPVRLTTLIFAGMNSWGWRRASSRPNTDVATASNWSGALSEKLSSKTKIWYAKIVAGSDNGRRAKKLNRNWNNRRGQRSNNVIFMRPSDASNCASNSQARRKRRVIVIKDFVWLAIDASVNQTKQKIFIALFLFCWRHKNISFRFADINECDENADVCRNGKYINAFGSFKCECRKGYRVNGSGNCEGELLTKLCSSSFLRSDHRKLANNNPDGARRSCKTGEIKFVGKLMMSITTEGGTSFTQTFPFSAV